MSVSIETANRTLAAIVAASSPGSTHLYNVSTGIHTVSHATRLTVTVDQAERAGAASKSYQVPEWSSDIRELVTNGVIVHHTFNKMIIEEAGTEAAYLASCQPALGTGWSDGKTLTLAQRLARARGN